MLFVIAGRYLTFSTLYGMRIFWLLSAALVAAGSMSTVFQAPVFVGALAGALVEYVVGIFVFVAHRRALRQQ
jgi:hypothetical protein